MPETLSLAFVRKVGRVVNKTPAACCTTRSKDKDKNSKTLEQDIPQDTPLVYTQKKAQKVNLGTSLQANGLPKRAVKFDEPKSARSERDSECITPKSARSARSARSTRSVGSQGKVSVPKLRFHFDSDSESPEPPEERPEPEEKRPFRVNIDIASVLNPSSCSDAIPKAAGRSESQSDSRRGSRDLTASMATTCASERDRSLLSTALMSLSSEETADWHEDKVTDQVEVLEEKVEQTEKTLAQKEMYLEFLEEQSRWEVFRKTKHKAHRGNCFAMIYCVAFRLNSCMRPAPASKPA